MRVVFVSCFGLAICGLLPACGSSDDSGGGSSSGGAAATDCTPTAPECYATDKNEPGAECLAKVDNTGQSKWTGRLTAIDVSGPAALSKPFIQQNIIDSGINLDQQACNEFGMGSFIWMYVIDPATSTIHTGGGLPVADPKAGGCFLTRAGTIPIAPIDAPVTMDADTKGFHATGIDVNVPIFVTPTDTTNPLILPLHQVSLDATFNDDSHDCVGHFNGTELELANNCKPDTKAVPPQRAWTTGGQLSGYITIDEADQVFITQLNETLCVVLAEDPTFNGTGGYCKNSDPWKAGQKPAGDWCSTSNSAGGCTDAWQLKGSFAAAAFKVNGDCP